MSKIILEKGKTGSNTLGGYEKVSALVGYFGTASNGVNVLALDTPLEFRNVAELEVYGITPELKPLLYRRISEYFRMAGTGARLWLLSLTQPQTPTFADMIATQAIKAMIANADGQIFQVGFCYIPTAAPTYVNGLPDYIIAAIQAAQTFADWCRTTNRPVHTILECAYYNAPAAAAQNLRNIQIDSTTLQAPQVSVVIGQDWTFADTLTDGEKNHAAVGEVLGCMAAQPVSYNIGEVATMVLTNAPRNLWITAGFSNHIKVKDSEADLPTLEDKGYIFGEYYEGNVCFNNDHNCTPVIVDDEGNMNEHSIAISRTNAKVFREIYRVFLQKLKMTVAVDAQTGLLPVGTRKYFEGLGNRIFENMTARQEVSGGETTVDAQSNLLFGDKILKVFYNWVPMGVVGRIHGIINIKKSLQQ
ncbi:MAG: DUF2586 family protein [Prevotellaceae bacterium]|jgi:hypothetical protein|nr:DUF2586 family protein [Prevotellaceae bacterium]